MLHSLSSIGWQTRHRRAAGCTVGRSGLGSATGRFTCLSKPPWRAGCVRNMRVCHTPRYASDGALSIDLSMLAACGAGVDVSMSFVKLLIVDVAAFCIGRPAELQNMTWH